MGIEIAEIVIEIECEFFAHFDPSIKIDGSVKSIEDYVLRVFKREVYLSSVNELNNIPIEDNRILSIGEYKLIRNTLKFLPFCLLYVPDQLNTIIKIRNMIQNRFDMYCDEDSIRKGVWRIIQKKLNIKHDVQPSQHLVRVLGAD